MPYDPRFESRLIECSLAIVSQRNAETHRNPGPHDDAEAELNQDRLIHAAREYVEHTADVKVVPG